MSIVTEVKQGVKAAKVDSIMLEIVHTLQVLLEVAIIPPDPVIPLLEEIVRIRWH